MLLKFHVTSVVCINIIVTFASDLIVRRSLGWHFVWK